RLGYLAASLSGSHFGSAANAGAAFTISMLANPRPTSEAAMPFMRLMGLLLSRSGGTAHSNTVHHQVHPVRGLGGATAHVLARAVPRTPTSFGWHRRMAVSRANTDDAARGAGATATGERGRVKRILKGPVPESWTLARQ